jgi:hypothetical protein
LQRETYDSIAILVKSLCRPSGISSNAICPIDPILAKVRRCASQQISPDDVRFGSKADIAVRLRNVRFTRKSGH